MEHFYEGIQGSFTWARLIDAWVAAAKHNEHWVEIGAWKGRSTAYWAVAIANSKKNITLSVVDMWEDAWHLRHAQPDPYEPATQAEFQANLAPVLKSLDILRGCSPDMARTFKDGSLDLVWIDADHSYEAVKLDIASWLPKVKAGGIIAGHDYTPHYPGVMQAVQEAFPGRVQAPQDTQSWVVQL